jgi:hypothetical protein
MSKSRHKVRRWNRTYGIHCCGRKRGHVGCEIASAEAENNRFVGCQSSWSKHVREAPKCMFVHNGIACLTWGRVPLRVVSLLTDEDDIGLRYQT